MALGSSIEWTNSTWNPVTGCTKMSSGCQHCYAERMAHRLQGTGLPQYRNGFQVTLHPEALELPLHWKKPQTIFVNSMSDCFTTIFRMTSSSVSLMSCGVHPGI